MVEKNAFYNNNYKSNKKSRINKIYEILSKSKSRNQFKYKNFIKV